jgi:hypothetical protein
MKPIRFTPHAEASLLAREIGRADAEAAIRQTPTRRQPTRKPREIVNWVYSDTVTGETMLLRAVIEETKSEIVVITVYKTSKLKKYLPKE